MSHVQQGRRYTPDEYYRLEAQADYRSEFYDGEIFAMAGGAEVVPLAELVAREVDAEILFRRAGFWARFPGFFRAGTHCRTDT